MTSIHLQQSLTSSSFQIGVSKFFFVCMNGDYRALLTEEDINETTCIWPDINELCRRKASIEGVNIVTPFTGLHKLKSEVK